MCRNNFIYSRILSYVQVEQTDEFTLKCTRGLRGRDNMVVGFTTTYAISAYHHCRCEFEFRSGEVNSIQHCDKVCQ